MVALQRWKDGIKIHIAYGTLPPGAVPQEVENLGRAVGYEEAEFALDAAEAHIAKPDFDTSASVAEFRLWAETEWIDEDGNGHEYLQALLDEMRLFATALGRDPEAFVSQFRQTATEAYWNAVTARVEHVAESIVPEAGPSAR